MSQNNSAQFGKVAVLMGGTSGERQVSLDGGHDVLGSLQAQGVDAIKVDGLEALKALLSRGSVDRVFNILHGPEGEDGRLQGLLDCFGVPFTGTGLLGSALSMNKCVSKQIWRQHGLTLANDAVLTRGLNDLSDAAVQAQAVQIGYPMVVKPVSQGSSLGVHLVHEVSELSAAVASAFELDDSILLEQYIDGTELAVSVLDGKVLPAIAIETDREFYDYDAKYVDDNTRYRCPCDLGQEANSRLAEITMRAYRAVQLEGWGRVDFIYSQNQFYVIEANTTPGMTSHSLVPKAAAEVGISFDELVMRILTTSCKRVAGVNQGEVSAHASS